MSTTTKEKPIRKRSKKPVAQVNLDPVFELMQRVFDENKEMNAATRIYQKDRKTLLDTMKAQKLTSIEHNGLVAIVATPVGEAIDVAKLQKLVTPDQFLQIVSATKDAVTKIVGTAIIPDIVVPIEGKENVSVKVSKD